MSIFLQVRPDDSDHDIMINLNSVDTYERYEGKEYPVSYELHGKVQVFIGVRKIILNKESSVKFLKVIESNNFASICILHDDYIDTVIEDIGEEEY